MESRPEFYPVYISGQYLTSEHLNETHDFLWQEEKASRYLLAGNGVVSGLVADFTGTPLLKKVTITPGAAATCDGYVVEAWKNLSFDKGVATNLSWYKTTDGAEHILDEVEYNKVSAVINPVNVVTLNAVELFVENTPANELPDGTVVLENAAIGITALLAISSYIVLAWAFYTDLENNHCQQGDCNTKGIQRNFRTRYFLLKTSQVPPLNSVQAELITCKVARIKKLSTAGSASAFNKASHDAFGISAAELGGYFTNAITGKQLGIIADLLGNDVKTLLGTTITRFETITGSVTDASCAQYYNLFAGDLAKAINELVVFYNEYSRKYPNISSKRIERCVILGGFRQTGIDQRRYYFLPAPEQVAFVFEKKKLKSLFLRALAMVNGFILTANMDTYFNKGLPRPKIIPTLAASDSLLQNNAVPAYYNVIDNGLNSDVFTYWNVQGGMLRNVHCYYDSKIAGRDTEMANKLPATDWYNYNFFRFEGHVGMSKATAITELSKLISDQGIPVQLLDCDVSYKGPKKWTDFYDYYITKLATWNLALKKDYTDYAFNPYKNIQETANQTSYRLMEDVTKTLNDLNAFSGIMYSGGSNPKAIGGKAMSKALAVNKSKAIPESAYGQFSKVIPQTDLKELNKKHQEAIAETGSVKTDKLITLSELVGLEYMGGALRGGTFVLLHDGSKVIGDGCLPYYYRVSQVRIFNPSA